MSVDNSELLMLLGGKKKAKQTIGVQGEIGFGGGLYGGDPADLEAIGLSPLPNNDDPTNENYGSYVHTNGSVMLFVPAFCYRIGNPSAPSYARDNDNALEIRDAKLGETDGFILHRAFIDGGKAKLGFFIDKYLCSKNSTETSAISVKNGDPIALIALKHVDSGSMPDCVGGVPDAITLGRARGEAYSCASGFMYAALAMLSVAQGQAVKSTKECAWFDPNYRTNYPKGNNNLLKDVNDSSVIFTQSLGYSLRISTTGSASNLAKTTHTGQIWGVTDINGNMPQPCLGTMNAGAYRVAKETTLMHSFTKDNFTDIYGDLYDDVPFEGVATSKEYYWGNNNYGSFHKESSGTYRAICGLIPKDIGTSKFGTSLFGYDYGSANTEGYKKIVIAAGSFSGTSLAGVFFRGIISPTDGGPYGFRVGGYAM